MKLAVLSLCLVFIIKTNGFQNTKLSDDLDLSQFHQMANRHFGKSEVNNRRERGEAISKLQGEVNGMTIKLGNYQDKQNSKNDDVEFQLTTIKKKLAKINDTTTSHDTSLKNIRQQIFPKDEIKMEFDILNKLNKKLSNSVTKNSEELKRLKTKIESLEMSLKLHQGEHEAACLKVSSLGYTYDLASEFCYKVHDIVKTWVDALDVCKQEGGSLAKIDTDPKMNIVRAIMREDPADIDYYLGATDSEEDGVWRWVVDNSTLPNFTMTGHKSCLEIDSVSLTLDDSGCHNSEQKFVCEVRQATLTSEENVDAWY